MAGGPRIHHHLAGPVRVGGVRIERHAQQRIVLLDDLAHDREPEPAAIDIGASFLRFRSAYLSGGVYLGGTGSANLLDDYEEGTWTPTNTGAALTVTQAKYTKVGRMVTVACFVTATANTSGDWGGLPFTIDVSGTYSGSVGYQNDTAGETWNVFADGGTSWTLRKGTTSEQLLSGKNLRMTLTYFTT